MMWGKRRLTLAAIAFIVSTPFCGDSTRVQMRFRCRANHVPFGNDKAATFGTFTLRCMIAVLLLLDKPRSCYVTKCSVAFREAVLCHSANSLSLWIPHGDILEEVSL